MVAVTVAFSPQDYFNRLQLDPSELDSKPTLAKLQAIQEAHLATIPFENTAQHGVNGNGPACLDVQAIAHKILDERRGGFCFELNGFLSVFLAKLGYSVKRVPARVCRVTTSPPPTAPTAPPADTTTESTTAKDQAPRPSSAPVYSYPPDATHMILVVAIPPIEDAPGYNDDGDEKKSIASNSSSRNNNNKYLVDVGFGEPPLHPLRLSGLGEEQVTPEGMCSKLVRKRRRMTAETAATTSKSTVTDGGGDDDDVVELLWKQSGVWVPRLEWSYAASMLSFSNDGDGDNLSDFAKALSLVQRPDNIFSQKLIVCRLTRDEKLVLAGNRFKRVKPRSFANQSMNNDDSAADVSGDDGVTVSFKNSIQYIETNRQARQVLRDFFGQPWSATEGLQLTKSKQADPSIWANT